MSLISVIGCGWFGLPLAKKLLDNGHTVFGSTTTPDKIPVLENSGIKATHLAIGQDEIIGNIELLLDSEIYIINIPPGRHSDKTKSYPNKIKTLISKLPNNRKIIFISSTSVYQNTNGVVNEDLECHPESESGKALIEVESLIQNENATILRFSGLIGPDRLPGRFLQAKKSVPNGQAPVNLVHQSDCINICTEVITKNIWGEVFNVCSPDHPEKQQYYSRAAINQGFEKPEFINELNSYKIIDGSKISRALNYTFRSIELD